MTAWVVFGLGIVLLLVGWTIKALIKMGIIE